MRFLLSLIALLAVASIVGCSNPPDAATPSPTAIATSQSPPFRLVGPQSPEAALDLPLANPFVLDLETGQVSALQKVEAKDYNAYVSNVSWLDNESLLVETTVGTYDVQLDGQIVPLGSLPTVTPETRRPISSPDGGWVAVELPVLFGRILVGPASHAAKYRFMAASHPAWAPSGHLLAFTGNFCTDFDLFLFDPESKKLRNLTESIETAAVEFVWKPDGSALAVDLAAFGVIRPMLGLIDTATGEIRTLIQIEGGGDLIPLRWSPDGGRLLFRYSGGRGWCEAVGRPDVGEFPPTTLTAIAPAMPVQIDPQAEFHPLISGVEAKEGLIIADSGENVQVSLSKAGLLWRFEPGERWLVTDKGETPILAGTIVAEALQYESVVGFVRLDDERLVAYSLSGPEWAVFPAEEVCGAAGSAVEVPAAYVSDGVVQQEAWLESLCGPGHDSPCREMMTGIIAAISICLDLGLDEDIRIVP